MAGVQMGRLNRFEYKIIVYIDTPIAKLPQKSFACLEENMKLLLPAGLVHITTQSRYEGLKLFRQAIHDHFPQQVPYA